ncbi:uncharacterized protein E0L32_006960 [Thyridium curvatum]|uniref:Uncharacterized protein n=1 Tax=Thyridium curvatum TaxID=1093900 RepID=A0A507AXE4_9PEZI|nr:uncharacterized protein E0L32_006960 [Thyridium curvatum]TPX12313.1 hypothetical protein E0L32_006960 [Thyridium curvatum]
MGLALRDPTGTSALPGLLSEHRYIPDTRGPSNTARHRNLLQDQQISRAKYARWAERHSTHQDAVASATGLTRPRKLHPHQIAVLNACQRSSAAGNVRMRKRTTRAARSWLDNEDEGRDLARSRVPLPSDGDRAGRRRPPSLERQEAFVDAATKKMRLPSPDARRAADEDADIKELYRMGLLYDDEHQRGSAFSLDAIVHDEPVYTLSIRKGRKGQKRKAVEGIDEAWHTKLPLDLSFAAFGDDDALAQWLISSSYESAEDQDAWEDYQSATTSDKPLTIVYELDDLPAPELLADDGNSDECSEDWAMLQEENDDGAMTQMEGGVVQATDNPDDWVMLM